MRYTDLPSVSIGGKTYVELDALKERIRDEKQRERELESNESADHSASGFKRRTGSDPATGSGGKGEPIAG